MCWCFETLEMYIVNFIHRMLVLVDIMHIIENRSMGKKMKYVKMTYENMEVMTN